jgi:Trk-type K+ transport system membrane component
LTKPFIISTFTPLILSAVLYASNGRFKIAYIDSLFLCVSAMTMGGLASVDLSSLTPWQQAILFIEMCLGSPVCMYVLVVRVRTALMAENVIGPCIMDNCVYQKVSAKCAVLLTSSCTRRMGLG